MKAQSEHPNSKSRFLIRRAKLRDMRTLVHHRRGMWEDMGVRNPAALDRADGAYEEWARVGLRSGDLVAWVVEAVNHGVVGGGCLWLRPEQPHPDVSTPVEPYLFSMFTEPEFRRKGIASRIIKEAVKWSRRKGYRRILLHANKKGRRLYRKHGFKRTWEMRLKFRQSQ